MTSVGVAVSTTGTRPAALERAVAMWENAGLEPVVTYDLEREGVAVTKNRGIAALMQDPSIEHLFLADDDMHPLQRFSWTRYTDDPALHLSLSWGKRRALGGDDQGHTLWSWPRGVLLYLHRSAVEQVGGMRTDYRVAHEHADLSRRIHQAGLTPHMFMDLDQDPHDWFHCEDWQRPGETPTQLQARRRRITTVKRTAADRKRIAELWAKYDGDVSFVEYR